MKQLKKTTKFIIQSGMIGAIYAVITLATSFLSFKTLQLRIAEALIMTVCFTPAAIPGLGIGCFIANIASPYGLFDTVLGMFVTLISAFCGYGLRKVKFFGIPVLTPLINVVLNALYVGFLEAFTTGSGEVFFISFTYVAISEAIVCYGMGIPLYFLFKTNKKIWTI